MTTYRKEAIPVEHDAWLKQRSKGIGGSDAGTVMGVNEYKSAFTLWAEKTGQLEAPYQSSEAIRLGHDLEDYVAKRFCEAEGKRVKRSSFCFESKERPYMRANVDRLVIGENAVLECKTANMMKGSSYKKDEIPASYYYQCLHYMAVLGLDRVYLAVLVFSHGLYTFVIDRADPQIQQDLEYLVQKEAEFWKHVQDGTKPEIDGSESTADTIATLYGRAPEDTQSFLDLTEMTPDFERRALLKSKVADLNSRVKAVKAEIQEIENRIGSSLEEFGQGLCGGQVAIWRESSTTILDQQRIKEEYPEIAAECRKTTTKMKLSVKKAPKPKKKKEGK